MSACLFTYLSGCSLCTTTIVKMENSEFWQGEAHLPQRCHIAEICGVGNRVNPQNNKCPPPISNEQFFDVYFHKRKKNVDLKKYTSEVRTGEIYIIWTPE